MAYFLDLFAPETYETFSRSDRTVSGHSPNLRSAAQKVHPGDRFICYLSEFSRWIGVLDVTSETFESRTPIFAEAPDPDPYVVRFNVQVIAWLDIEEGISMRDDRIWNALSYTRGQPKEWRGWAGKVRSSLRPLSDEDGSLLETTILAQQVRRDASR
jgi:hypothetical protein